MATRLKTVEYWFPELADVTDNTDTNFTQITVYLPETGTKTFRSAVLEVIIQDAEATANNVSRRQISLQLGTAGYSDINNTNVLTASSEQKWLLISGDFTSYFQTNWTGTSMTCDAKVLCDSAIATSVQNWRSATAKLTITYEYDDTSTTHVKTVRVPLSTPIANLATSKPGSPTATIPNLSTYLPEDSVTIRQVTVVVQGNDEYASTTDRTISWEVDTLGAYTTSAHESALNTSCWFRHSQIQSFATNASHSWYIYCGGAASFAHLQAWMVVTYEFNSTNTTTVLNSLMLPMEFDSPAGGTTSSDYQRATRTLWIEEPGTITVKESALFIFWEQAAAISGMQYRVNGGSWSGAITSTAATVAGGCGSMFRCESDLSSLARGRNTLSADIFRTDTADFGMNVSSVWMLNYTSDKDTNGVGVHNHTVFWGIKTTGTVANSGYNVISATAPVIPETSYFITALGIHAKYMTNTTGNPAGLIIQAERLASEGGIKWEDVYSDTSHTDALVGIRQAWSQGRDVFYRFPGDLGEDRIDLESSRRWAVYLGGGATGWFSMNLCFTYHAITKTISGTISGSAGGTVDLKLHRTATGELVLSTSRVGDGAYSFTWYDDTEYMYVVAKEDSTHLGRSNDLVAS